MKINYLIVIGLVLEVGIALIVTLNFLPFVGVIASQKKLKLNILHL